MTEKITIKMQSAKNGLPKVYKPIMMLVEERGQAPVYEEGHYEETYFISHKQGHSIDMKTVKGWGYIPQPEIPPSKLSAQELFEKYEDEYGNFEAVENKRSTRPDLHALLLLAELDPSKDKIVSGVSHHEIEFSPSNDFIETLTDSQVLELIRCKVRYEDGDYLAMFA